MANRFSEITPQIVELTEKCIGNSTIDPELYGKYDVKRGLRDINGKGVLAGLTDISEVRSYTVVDNEMVPCEGKLFYRGVDIEKIVSGFIRDKRFGFEETAYLLLFGELPTQKELDDFCTLLANYRTLPTSFVRDIIMKAPSADMMNTLARSVLTLYSYDENANDISLPNVLRQSLQLIALFPLLAVYGYQAYVHYHDGKACLSTSRCRSFPQRRIFYTFCVRIANTRSWKRKSSTLHSCFTRSTAAGTTRRLRRAL